MQAKVGANHRLLHIILFWYAALCDEIESLTNDI
jgi:hypothetical protein